MAVLGLCCYVWAFSSCGALAFHCDSFPYCRAWALGTVVMAHGLSHPAACGIFPDQEEPMLNPCPLHWQVGSSPLDHQGGSKLFGFDIEKYFLFTLQKVEPVYTPTKVYNKDMNCRT